MFIILIYTLTKSAVMMASSVCEPGNQIALMIKLPVASCGCNTRWSDTEPVLLKVSTWQSCEEMKGKKKNKIVKFNEFLQQLFF